MVNRFYFIKDIYRDQQEVIYLQIDKNNCWRLGSFGQNVNNQLYVFLYNSYEIISRSHYTMINKYNEVKISKERYNMFLQEWNKEIYDNARRSMIVNLFDHRKDRSYAPKNTTLK